MAIMLTRGLVLFALSLVILSSSNLISLPLQSNSLSSLQPQQVPQLRLMKVSGDPQVYFSIVLQPRDLQVLEQIVQEHRVLSPSQVSSLFSQSQEVSEVRSLLSAHGIASYSLMGLVVYGEAPLSTLSQALGVTPLGVSNTTLGESVLFTGPLPFPGSLTATLGGEVRPQFLTRVNTTQALAFSSVTPQEIRMAYNMTLNGSGTTVGVLDFYGDPYIYQEVSQFDSIYGLPSANLTVIPIGPYDPECGVATGWSLEMSLDVEYAHASAPAASLVAYVANPQIPLPVVFGYIVNQDKVDVLSMSFGIPEIYVAEGQVPLSLIQSLTYLFLLGEAEGITFVASSGDAGATGYDFLLSPYGGLVFPASDPYVLSVGGSSLYSSQDGYVQTGWSGNGVFGASTGGRSVIFPAPWYQGIGGFRGVPDVVALANPYTGVNVVYYHGLQVLVGGTSVAAPIVAGIIAQADQIQGRLGFVNPLLYQDREAVEPVGFGYNSPYVANNSYNLVTGLGYINAGVFAHTVHRPSQYIAVGTYNITFRDGQRVTVVVNSTVTGPLEGKVYNGSGFVDTFPLVYNGSQWVGYFNATGNGVLEVVVSSGLVTGASYVTVGKQAVFISPPVAVLSQPGGFLISVQEEYANGTIAPVSSDLARLQYYNPINGSMALVNTTVLGEVFSLFTGSGSQSLQGLGYLSTKAPQGVYFLTVQGAYGFSQFVYGDYVVPVLFPSVGTEPLTVAPGQNVTVEVVQVSAGLPNTTLEFMNSSGGVAYEIPIHVIQFGNGSAYIDQFLMPQLPSGVYTVVAKAFFPGRHFNISGTGVTQIYVAPSLSIHASVVPEVAYENQTVRLQVQVDYPNGSPVRYGMFTAVVTPSGASGEFETVQTSQYVQLNYTNGSWVGYFQVPAGDRGNFYGQGVQGLAGTWDVYVSGVSWDGFPTPTSLSLDYSTLSLSPPKPSAQFAVVPLVYTPFFNGTVAYGLFIENATIIGHNATFIDSIVQHLKVRDGEVQFINSTVYQSTGQSTGPSLGGILGPLSLYLIVALSVTTVILFRELKRKPYGV